MSIEEQVAALEASFTQLAADAQAQENPYLALKATFRLASAPTGDGYIENDSGQIMYANGTIYDPETGEVYYPNKASGIDPADVPGSPQWVAKIQAEWSEEKANEWRKKLVSLGFDEAVSGGIATKGGFGQDLIAGLQAYHSSRYSNFGKVLPVRPGGAGGERLKDIVDPVALKEEVKGWGQVPFEEDLDDDTAEYFTGRVMAVAHRLMKNKGWDATRAFEGAGVRVQKEFLGNKDVDTAINEAEEDELDETLRNDVVSIAQLGAV